MNPIALLTAIGVPAKFARLVAFAILAVVIFLSLWGAKCAYDKHVVQTHETKIAQRAAPATDKAATERAQDTITIAKSEQEAHDAVHSVPDAAPAGPSHALACKRLRDHGRHPASCGGPPGAH